MTHLTIDIWHPLPNELGVVSSFLLQELMSKGGLTTLGLLGFKSNQENDSAMIERHSYIHVMR